MASPVNDVLWLEDPRAQDPAVTGAKAASLARAYAADLPIVRGFVIPTAMTDRFRAGGSLDEETLREPWDEISRDGTASVIVRSSSTLEDQAGSSMAGMFESVAGVQDRTSFTLAVTKVIRSCREAPIAVLVQRELEAVRGGVAFGADPISGRHDRRVVAAVDGAPGALVGGLATGARYTLTPSGRVVEKGGDASGALTWAQRRELLRLSARCADLFGSPQDIEWAFDRNGSLWLLQSRPITALARPAEAHGPLFGPGPIAETFPEPLALLEQDLWIDPLREAIGKAVLIAGAASKRRLARSPVITLVGGRTAIDLDLIGLGPRGSLLVRLDPRPALRRLAASWRVGRLRAALPELARRLIRHIDEELAAIPPMRSLSDDDLLGILHSSRRRLIAIHGHEVLTGLVMTKTAPVASGAGMALRVMSFARAAGRSDAEIIASDPTVLALIPPSIPPSASLPEVPETVPEPSLDADPLGRAREDLRLRARWMQELTARVSSELGHRLADRGVIDGASSIRWLRLGELADVLSGDVLSIALEERETKHSAPPLPFAFRLEADGGVVAETAVPFGDGQGAVGGRTTGTVRRELSDLRSGDVLVVHHLDPKLASILPSLGGLVAETGSVLSHLAILAREYGVPTVVGVPDAVDRFPDGATVLVDGTVGEVIILDADGVA